MRSTIWRPLASPSCQAFLFGFCLLAFGLSPSPLEAREPVVLRDAIVDFNPKLDPQKSYTISDARYLSLVYEQLLCYSYLERPLELQPELSTAVPKPTVKKNKAGKVIEVRYRFPLREGARFPDHACFEGGKGRAITAHDFAYAFKRIADPQVASPAFSNLMVIKGFTDYRAKLDHFQKGLKDRDFRARNNLERQNLPTHLIYDKVGDIPGVKVINNQTLELILDRPMPRLLHWLTLPFVSAMAWEASEARPYVILGSGPLQIDTDASEIPARVFFERQTNWWGDALDKPELGTSIPTKSPSPTDTKNRFWRPMISGRPLPYITRLELRQEENIGLRMDKFLKGEFDLMPHSKEIDQILENSDILSAKTNFEKKVQEKKIFQTVQQTPSVAYLFFNMEDDLIGAPKVFTDLTLQADREVALSKRRKLRQALSLAIDLEGGQRLCQSMHGIPAIGPIPPGIPGYDKRYKNPYRHFDPALKKARKLLSEAGYPDGIDPETKKPLSLNYLAPSSHATVQLEARFFAQCWRILGIELTIKTPARGSYEEAIDKGEFQISSYAWIADFPDPENFLFLFYGPNSRKYQAGSPNVMHYESPAYDRIFEAVQALEADEKQSIPNAKGKPISINRSEAIVAARDHLQDDCPWIPLFHSETKLLLHQWMEPYKDHPVAGSEYRFLMPDDRKRRLLIEEWDQATRKKKKT